MHIRQVFTGVCLTLVVGVSHAQAVVQLPGIKATARPDCVQPAEAGTAGLSYACLNQQLTTPPPMPSPLETNDVRKQPSNKLGLYNAAALGHRMGTNLGRSVTPARPTVTYPSPLTAKP